MNHQKCGRAWATSTFAAPNCDDSFSNSGLTMALESKVGPSRGMRVLKENEISSVDECLLNLECGCRLHVFTNRRADKLELYWPSSTATVDRASKDEDDGPSTAVPLIEKIETVHFSTGVAYEFWKKMLRFERAQRSNLKAAAMIGCPGR